MVVKTLVEKPQKGKDMERLTKRDDNGRVYYPHCDKVKGCGGYCAMCNFNTKISDKLAKYEDAEEQGLLLKLPCKVGDTVFALLFTKNNPRYCECAVEQIIINAGIVEINVLMKFEHIRSRLDINMFGKTIFFTQEEAEKALAELSNKTEY